MITLAKVNQATRAFIKVLRYGNADYQTSEQYLPYGVDSKPVNGINAAHATTSNNSDTIVFAYKIESSLTNPGEIRIYATDSDGVDVFSLLLKNDGTAEFGGNTDNLVRFLKLDNALQLFITDLNAKLVTALGAVGGSWPGTSLDISQSKIDEIKSS